MVWESVKWPCKWHIEVGGGGPVCSSQWKQTLLCPPAWWSSLAPGTVEGVGPRQIDDTCIWHARLASRQTPGGKPPWCGISVRAGPRRSKVTEMRTRSALRASRGLRGRHVFLIEPQWSEESLILISGDRNPIFRGDSWESGSPCVRDDCLPVKPSRFKRPGPALYTQRRSTSIWHEPCQHSAPTVSL